MIPTEHCIFFCSKRFWQFAFLATSSQSNCAAILNHDRCKFINPTHQSLAFSCADNCSWLFANHSWLRFPATKGALQVKGFKSFVMEENNLRIWNSSYQGDTKATLKIGQIWRKTCQKGAGGWGLPKSQRKHTKYTKNNKNIEKELCWEKHAWNAKWA